MSAVIRCAVLPKSNVVPFQVSADPLVATLLPFRYRTPLAVPAEKVGLLVSVVMDAEVLIKFVIVADAEVSVVMLAEAMLRLLMTMLVAVRFVIDADAAFKSTKDPSEQVRLLGFVPSSITALAEVME